MVKGKMDTSSNILSGLSALLSVTLENPIAQWTLFALSVASLALGIILRIWNIIKEKKKDGRIDSEDTYEILHEAKEAIDEAKEELKGDEKK